MGVVASAVTMGVVASAAAAARSNAKTECPAGVMGVRASSSASQSMPSSASASVSTLRLSAEIMSTDTGDVRGASPAHQRAVPGEAPLRGDLPSAPASARAPATVAGDAADATAGSCAGVDTLSEASASRSAAEPNGEGCGGMAAGKRRRARGDGSIVRAKPVTANYSNVATRRRGAG